MKAVGVNMACVSAANSFYIGGNWGFILNTHPDYEQMYKIMKNDGDVKIYEVENGIIVFVNPNYLHSVLSQVDSIGQDVLMKHQTRPTEEVAEFQKYLMGVLKDTVKCSTRTPDYDEYVFAIYSCSNLHKLRLNGMEYPAFSLTEVEAIKEISKMRKYLDIYFAVENSFKNISELVGDSGIKEVLKGLEISPTMNGVFMTIRVIRKR